jgi:hypothetical protein
MSIPASATAVTDDAGVHQVELTIGELRIRTSAETAIMFAARIALAASSFGTESSDEARPQYVTDVLMATSATLETVH